MQDQFLRIELAQKLNLLKNNLQKDSPNANRLKSKLSMLENVIEQRLEATNKPIMLEEFFKENELNEKEQMIFLALLKEEYTGNDDSLRELNSLIDLISNDDYEKIKHRSLFARKFKTLIKKID